MKKSLVALAVLAATGAYAQSSVTLYGIVEATSDIGYSKKTEAVTTTGGVATTARTEQKNNFRIQDGNSQGTGTSRIGFRGTEDLGGGLKANFLLEMGIRVDDGCVTTNATVAAANACSSGNSGGNLFGRNAWGGVSGGFGEVRVGRQVLGSFGVQANSVAAGSSLGLYESSAAQYLPMGGVRFSNAIKYLSPKVGGFSGTLTLAAPETEGATSGTTGGGVVTTASRRTGVDLALEFANGPVYVGFGYNLRDTGNTISSSAGTSSTGTAFSAADPFRAAGKATSYTLGGSYDLGVVKPFINYTRQSIQGQAVAGAATYNGNETMRATSIGLRAPVGAITVIAGYGRVITSGSVTSNTTDSLRNEAKRNSYQLGAQYALSKRTLLEANYGQTRLNNDTDNSVATVASSIRATERISAFNVGLKHSF